MSYEPHDASGRLRDPSEIKREIKEREDRIRSLHKEMVALDADSLMWKAKKVSCDKHISIIAVLRWVLGEDLLWE